MWFKKKANISGYNANTAVDGSDWRTVGKITDRLVSNTLPNTGDAGNYFYLPALGAYNAGYLDTTGSYGFYWSSSAYPAYNEYAYTLFFNNSHVYVNYNGRLNGYRVEPSFK